MNVSLMFSLTTKWCSSKSLKLKLGVSIIGCFVAVTTFYLENMTIMPSSLITQFDTILFLLLVKAVRSN